MITEKKLAAQQHITTIVESLITVLRSGTEAKQITAHLAAVICETLATVIELSTQATALEVLEVIQNLAPTEYAALQQSGVVETVCAKAHVTYSVPDTAPTTDSDATGVVH